MERNNSELKFGESFERAEKNLIFKTISNSVETIKQVAPPNKNSAKLRSALSLADERIVKCVRTQYCLRCNMELQKKIARICWNENNWISPSGRKGKSLYKKSYEYLHGFGHEEWNFDITRITDGYVYGYLQQFGNVKSYHRGHSYDIVFYSINSITQNRKEYWLIGSIKNIKVIEPNESKRIYLIYERNGWIQEMIDDLDSIELDGKIVRNAKPESFFNIRFKQDDIHLLDEPILIPRELLGLSAYYYNLYDRTDKTINKIPRFD